MSWEIKTVIDPPEGTYRKYEFVCEQVRLFLFKKLIVLGFGKGLIDGDVSVELNVARPGETDLLLEEPTHQNRIHYHIWVHYPKKEKSDWNLAEN